MSTKIEWTDETWNPVTGCDRISTGCGHCYIERTFPFRKEGRRFDDRGRMGVRLHRDRLERPLHWAKRRHVFVCSLADLFHQDVPDEFIAEVFAVMAQASEHTFQVLTKRPQRMARLLGDPVFRDRITELACVVFRDENGNDTVPGPNVLLGISAENQRYLDLRVPYLLDTRAWVRFVSLEPLLGPIDLRGRPAGERLCIRCGEGPDAPHDHPDGYRIDGLNWVIAGGESGPGARPMHPEWARSIRDQCQRSGVPFFFKQWGEWWAPVGPVDHLPRHLLGNQRWLDHDGTLYEEGKTTGTIGARCVYRVGKKVAGRELEGRTWDEMPEPAL